MTTTSAVAPVAGTALHQRVHWSDRVAHVWLVGALILLAFSRRR